MYPSNVLFLRQCCKITQANKSLSNVHKKRLSIALTPQWKTSDATVRNVGCKSFVHSEILCCIFAVCHYTHWHFYTKTGTMS